MSATCLRARPGHVKRIIPAISRAPLVLFPQLADSHRCPCLTHERCQRGHLVIGKPITERRHPQQGGSRDGRRHRRSVKDDLEKAARFAAKHAGVSEKLWKKRRLRLHLCRNDARCNCQDRAARQGPYRSKRPAASLRCRFRWPRKQAASACPAHWRRSPHDADTGRQPSRWHRSCNAWCPRPRMSFRP